MHDNRVTHTGNKYSKELQLSLGVSRNTVFRYLRNIRQSGTPRKVAGRPTLLDPEEGKCLSSMSVLVLDYRDAIQKICDLKADRKREKSVHKPSLWEGFDSTVMR